MERDTVLLDLQRYDNLKYMEKEYYELRDNLEKCITRRDKKGNLVNGFYIEDPTTSIELDIHMLAEILDIDLSKIEIIM